MELSKLKVNEVIHKQWEVSLVVKQMDKAYKTESLMKKLQELGTNLCQQIGDSFQRINL